MQIKNSTTKYGFIAKSMHWVVALLIICAWIAGDYMTDLPNTDSLKFQIYSLHKSVGMCILMLVIIRFSWKLYDMQPRDPVISKPLLLLAHVVQYLLYVFMFVQPLSGWLLSSAAEHLPTFFGLFTFPGLIAKNQMLVSFYGDVHSFSADVLLVLFLLHVSGALFHYFIVKDDTVQRMM